jgi:membrane-associated phospholipid phosphatase
VSPPYGFELDWIAAFQNGGAFRLVMVCLSFFGSEVCVCVVPFVYLVFSRSAGQRLFLLFAVSGLVQQALKLAWQGPRPYWLDARIKALDEAGGFGMPSGHVQSAVVIWSYVARISLLPKIWLAALALVLLVAVSRVYLGVHFISDTVGGLLTGGLVLWGFIRCEAAVARQLAGATFRQRLGWALGSTLVLLAIGLVVQMAAGGPVRYLAPDGLVAKAQRPSGLFLSIGMWSGAALGMVFARRWAPFEVGGALWKRGLALIVTLGGVWVIRKISRWVPDTEVRSLQCLLGFFYGLGLNIWMVFLAPLGFIKLKWLARVAESELK